MATNVLFSNFRQDNTTEQLLYLDLITESIQIYGHNIYYIPREGYSSMDKLFGELANAKFSSAYLIDMFITNVEGYEGDGDFFSKFGLEIRDSSNFVVSWRTFNRFVPNSIRTRPREGDLLYVPTLQKLFEIKFVEEELLFFSLGRTTPYIYELRAEAFRFSNENIETGVQDVDQVAIDSGYAQQLYLSTGSGNYIIGESVSQANNTYTAKITDWDPIAKIVTVHNIVGSTQVNIPLVGAVSNTRYLIAVTEDMDKVARDDNYDNRILQTEANTIIDLTETSPFGSP